jgi:hypothetical protein
LASLINGHFNNKFGSWFNRDNNKCDIEKCEGTSNGGESFQMQEGNISYNQWIDEHEGPILFLKLY